MNEKSSNLPTLNEQTLSYVDKEIAQRKYESVIEFCLSLLNKNIYVADDKIRENLYELLERISLISDKSPSVVDHLIPKMLPLLSSSDDWIRTESLIITEKISKYRPNALIDLIESIENCLIDEDNNIREIALNTIGNLIMNLHINREGLFYSLIRAMNDESWRIRVRSLEIFESIVKSGRMDDTILLNRFVELIANMVNDTDAEVQGIAIEKLKDISTFIMPQTFLKVLSKLILDEEWNVQEKGIWLVGEVGAKDYISISLILGKLVGLLNSPNLMVQTKVIDAFVKIGRKHPDEIIPIIFENLFSKDEEIYNALFEIFIYLGIERPENVFVKIFDFLDAPDMKSRKFVSGALLKLKNEIPEKIEDQVASLFVKLESSDWRERSSTVKILGDVNFIIKQKSVAVWSYIKINELMEIETDPEVKEAAIIAIEKVNNSIDEIGLIIAEIEQQQNFFYSEIMNLQKLPKSLKTKMLNLLERREFREASISLEEEINKSIKKIESYGNNIYNYQYKRLAVDLIEDWSYSRLDLLEQIGDIKAYILKRIKEAKKAYLIQLKEQISRLQARIDVLKSELTFLADLNSQLKNLISNGKDQEAKKKLEHLSYIRDKIFRIETEIGQLWIENLDFKEELKEVTVYWVQIKIEAQQILYAISFNLRDMYRFMEEQQKEKSSESTIKTEISFEILLNQFQNLVLQSTKSVKDQFERFSIIILPVQDEIMKGNFDNAQNLLELTISQTQTNIEDFNKEIVNLYAQLDEITQSDMEKSSLIRKYLQDWVQIKDSLIERSNEFAISASQEIFQKRILSLQKIINPIPIKAISKKLQLNESEILERLFNIIEKGLLKGKIKNNQLFLPEDAQTYNKTIFLSKKMEIIGRNIHFRIRIANNTKSYIHDLSVLFSFPEFLELDTNKSDTKWFEIKDFDPEQIQLLHWILKIKKNVSSDDLEGIGYTGQKSYRFGEIRAIIRYKDMFGNPQELDRRLDVLVPINY